MRAAAVVPFKALSRAKQRLRASWSEADVEEIGRAMLLDVLSALRGAPDLERVTVLTDDADVARIARSAGAQARVTVPDPGLNPVIELATAAHAAEGFEALLVALGDLPLLSSEAVERVLEAGRAAEVVLVPSGDGGTALLLRRPPGRIPAHFGPQSAEAHARAAQECGARLERLALGGHAGLDVDTPEDVERVLRSGRTCRTAEVLRKLGG